MRRFRGSPAMVVALVAVVLSVSGSAVAAKLITGKQIKNGTITKADLSKALQARLQATAQPGATGAKGDTGPKGDAGAPGPGAVKVDGDIVSPAVAKFTAPALGTLGVSLTGCQDISGSAVLRISATTPATIAISWSFTGVEQTPSLETIGPGNDYEFPTMNAVGYQVIHGVYRDAGGNVATLDLVARVINSGGAVRTCRLSGALVPAS